jgi:hypothetical protein
MVLENVRRISAPEPAVLFRDFVDRAEPVILTGLFDHARLRELDTLEQAKRALPDLELEIQPNYLTFLETGEPGERRSMTLAAYLEHVAQNPRTRDLCIEFPTPRRLLELLPLAEHAAWGDPTDIVSATFLANAGNYTHLHFDDDQRNVLLYEVFGTKRFSLIAPERWRMLDAFLFFDAGVRKALAAIPARDANGRVFLHTFPSEDARDAFLRYLGAHDCLLHPGETLLIPALFWHYVEYRDTSLSVTYRLGRNSLNRALSELFPLPTLFVQTVAAKLTNAERFEREQPALFAELGRLLGKSYPSLDDRRRDVQAWLEGAFETLFGESAAAVTAARELHRQALAL